VQLEVPLFNTAKEKMMVLAKAVTDHDSANTETKFVQDAVTQLLKARHVLKCSYVYGYYLEETGYKKPIYEFMQVRSVYYAEERELGVRGCGRIPALSRGCTFDNRCFFQFSVRLEMGLVKGATKRKCVGKT